MNSLNQTTKMRKLIKKDDYFKIAQGVPLTNKQRIKYQSWKNSKQFLHDSTFVHVPSSGRCLHETIHLGNNDWLLEAKSQFNLSEWLNISGTDNVPVHLEICSGFGQWFCKTVKQASQNNNDRWIACDIKFRRCISILGRLHYYLENHTNARVMCGNAKFVLEHFFPDESLNTVYIRFPEPWSTRPEKRIINDAFTRLLHSKIKQSGHVVISTDHEMFKDGTLQVFEQVNDLWKFEDLIIENSENNVVTEEDQSYEGGFENLLRARGCTIYTMKFQRK
jgi:tRNA (guanine-N7-)-methyltransferase